MRLVQASGTKSAPVWLLGTICPKTALKHITSHSGSTTRGDRNGVNGALCKEGISRSKDGTPGGVWAGRSAFAMAMGCCWYCSHHPPPRLPFSLYPSSSPAYAVFARYIFCCELFWCMQMEFSCSRSRTRFVSSNCKEVCWYEIYAAFTTFLLCRSSSVTAGKALPRPGSPFQSRRTFLWWFLTQF